MNYSELNYWKELFETLFENSNDAIAYFDINAKVKKINKQFTKTFGYSHSQAVHRDIYEVVDPHNKLTDRVVNNVLKGNIINFQTTRCDKEGNDIPVLVHGIPFIVDNEVIGGFAIYINLTEALEIESRIVKFSHALEYSPNAVVITDNDGNIEYVSKRFVTMTGYQANDVIGKNPKILRSGKTRPEVYRELWATIKRGETWRGELQNKKKDGSIYWESMSISSIKNNNNETINYVAIKEDITKRKELEQSNYYLAHHDPLTGLPNRMSFINDLNKLLESNTQQTVAVLFIDVDRFKKVNDSLGHDIGDLLLQAVAERLQDTVVKMPKQQCGCSVIYRLGGDEFTVILKDASFVTAVADAIIHDISKPITIIDKVFFITVSIGISVYPKDGEESMTLLRNADTAMYAAKELGKNQYKFYTKDMNDRAEEMLSLESDLQLAIERQQLELYYQPQVNMQTRKIIGYEALS